MLSNLFQSRAKKESTALQAILSSANAGELDKVKSLVKNMPSAGYSAITLANNTGVKCLFQCPEIIEHLSNPDTVRDYIKTAAATCRTDAMSALLEKATALEILFPEEKTYNNFLKCRLLMAALYGSYEMDQVSIGKLLVQHGADVEGARKALTMSNERERQYIERREQRASEILSAPRAVVPNTRPIAPPEF